MSKGTEGHFDTLPIGRLGLIPLNSSAALGKKVDDYLVSWRKGRGNEFAEKYVAPILCAATPTTCLRTTTSRI